MPRPPTFKPYKRADVWYVYVPDRGMVTLPCETKSQAEQIAAREKSGWHARKAGKPAKVATADAPAPAAMTPPPPATSPQSMLATWAEKTPPAPDAPATPEVTPAPAAKPETALTAPAPDNSARANELMPEERRRKLADMCARLAVRVDILLIGASVRVFGRVPAEPDPDERAVLQEGLSMVLDDYFVNSPPTPWHVVIGASIGIGISMYVDGRPIPKKPALVPPEDENAATARRDSSS